MAVALFEDCANGVEPLDGAEPFGDGPLLQLLMPRETRISDAMIGNFRNDIYLSLFLARLSVSFQ